MNNTPNKKKEVKKTHLRINYLNSVEKIILVNLKRDPYLNRHKVSKLYKEKYT